MWLISEKKMQMVAETSFQILLCHAVRQEIFTYKIVIICIDTVFKSTFIFVRSQFYILCTFGLCECGECLPPLGGDVPLTL